MNQQPMTEATFYILLALLRPGHGYGIMQRVKEISGGRVQVGPGTLYGVLNRMRKDGLATLETKEERRKIYALTSAGRQALEQERERLRRMVEDGDREERYG